VIDFIRELRKRKHQVFVFTQDRKGEKEEFLEGVHVERFPWIKSGKPLVQLNPFNPMDVFRILNLLYHGRVSLPRFIKEKRIKICLALWILPGGYFANHAFRRTKVPYSVWSLGSDIYRYGKYRFLHPLMRRIIHEAKGVFADGFDLSRRIEERFGRKCFFLATTRSLSHFSPPSKETSPRASLIPPDPASSTSKPYRFLFVGRIEKVKGIDLLLEAMACLKEEGGNVHLTVVGRGGMEAWAKRFIKERDLGEHVSWMEGVSEETLASLYESSDCVVIPSRSESIPLVFSEALRFDKDLIVSDVGDMGTLGRQFGVARVVPSEDRMALKEVMKKRAELGDQGTEHRDEVRREELKRLFDMKTSVERFLADYM